MQLKNIPQVRIVLNEMQDQEQQAENLARNEEQSLMQQLLMQAGNQVPEVMQPLSDQELRKIKLEKCPVPLKKKKSKDENPYLAEFAEVQQ